MDDQIEEELKAFYRERLLPIAEKYSHAFPLGLDKSVESYYVNRSDDGNYIHALDASDLESELRKMWGGESPELAELAGELIQLADSLQEKEEASDEVSPFVYAMF